MDGWDIMVLMIFQVLRPFPQLDIWIHSGRPLAHFWRPRTSKWLTFGSPWLPFGSLWAPFVSLLAQFGSLWFTFGILFDEIMKTFINCIHVHELSRLVKNFYEVSCFSRHNSEENTQQPDLRTPHPLLDSPLPPGPERNLAVGNFDIRSGPEGARGVFKSNVTFPIFLLIFFFFR